MPRQVETELTPIIGGQRHGAGHRRRHAERLRRKALQIHGSAVESYLRLYIVGYVLAHMELPAAQIDVAVQAVEEGLRAGGRSERYGRVRVDLARPFGVVEERRQVETSQGQLAVEAPVRVLGMGDSFRRDVARRGPQVEIRREASQRAVEPDVDRRLQLRRPDSGEQPADLRK